MLKYHFDQNLRDVPENIPEWESYCRDLAIKLEKTEIVGERVRILCDLGAHLRTLGQLETAKNHLKEAVELCETYQLEQKTLIRAQILLAHVFQWQENFLKSNRLFGELIITVETDPNLQSMKAFVYQHAGKNLFDQKLYQHALKFFEKALKDRLEKGAPEDQVESSRWAISRCREILQSQSP